MKTFKETRRWPRWKSSGRNERGLKRGEIEGRDKGRKEGGKREHERHANSREKLPFVLSLLVRRFSFPQTF